MTTITRHPARGSLSARLVGPSVRDTPKPALAVAGSESSHGSEGEEEEAPTLTSELEDSEKPRKPRRAKTKPQEGCAFVRLVDAVQSSSDRYAPLLVTQVTCIPKRWYCLE